MRKKTPTASVSSRCCMCGWYFDYEVAPCAVCERMICTGCSTQSDLLAQHLDRDALYFLQRAEAAMLIADDGQWGKVAALSGTSIRATLEGIIERRIATAISTLKDPKGSAVRLLKVMKHNGGAVPHFDRAYAARILAMHARHDLPSQAMTVPLMRDVDGMIVRFEPFADLSDTLPPLLRRRLHPQPEDLTEEETPHHDDDGPRARPDNR